MVKDYKAEIKLLKTKNKLLIQQIKELLDIIEKLFEDESTRREDI